MMIKRNLFVLPALLLTLGIVAGCGPKTPPASSVVAPTPPASLPERAQAEPSVGNQAVSKTPIKDSVEKLLTQQEASDHPFIPKGTKLLSADFKDGVATLDFSHEFNALADRGDTVESEAQKALRRALASVQGVDKMRVTVEGHPFESQATDWNTPFPVRDTEGDGEARGIETSDRSGDKQ
jgi:predicted small lipoprotein YifL